MHISKSFCALCDTEVLEPIVENEQHFCCPGCRVVYNVLSAKNELVNFQETYLFKQAVTSGLISNPQLLEKIKDNNQKIVGEESEIYLLEIGDMWCPSCSEIIKLLLLQTKGVRNAFVDYITDLAKVEYSPRYVSKETLKEIVKSFGYKAFELDDPEKKKVQKDLYIKAGLAGFCALNTMMFSYPLYFSSNSFASPDEGAFFSFLSLFAALPAVTYCFYPILKKAYQGMLFALLGMEFLVVIGVVASFSYSIYQMWQGSTDIYFDSMCVIIALVLSGKIIEQKAKFSTKETLHYLSRSLPKKVRVKEVDGSNHFISIKELKLGDILTAYTGEKIPVDAIVVNGFGACDESLMTGEASFKQKATGDILIAGSILMEGVLDFKATKIAGETTLDKIIALIQEDLSEKKLYERAVDKVVYWFVPIVLILSVLAVFVSYLQTGSFKLLNAVAVLLIACPCAIGIAAPLVESKTLSLFSSLGVFVRNRGALFAFSKIDKIAFDKTGTLTKGKFKIIDGLNNLKKEEKIYLKSLADKSIHPLSRAIKEELKDLPVLDLQRVTEYPGKGLKAYFKEKSLMLGSLRFLEEEKIVFTSDESKNTSASIVYFCVGEKVYPIYLKDEVKEHVEEMLRRLPVPSLMLSGDRKETVAEIADQIGILEYYYGLTPVDKKNFILAKQKQGENICFVGDGINDAPALTSAKVGISVFEAADLSVEVSDFLLTADNLLLLPKIFSITKKMQRIIRQNLFWAFIYNIIGIGMALFGLLTPIFATFAMVMSSLIVVLNAKRMEMK